MQSHIVSLLDDRRLLDLCGRIDAIALPAPTDACTLELCVMRFDAAAFSPMAFMAAGIDCPPSIAASVQRRQAEFFFGRLAARIALAGIDDALRTRPVTIGVSREPVWPENVVGSISHNGLFAVATAMPASQIGGIGIDVEGIVSEDARQALLAVAISPAECDYLRGLGPAISFDLAVTLVFSAKESFYKGAFGVVGRFFDFSAARLGELDVGAKALSLILQVDLAPPFLRGTIWRIDYSFLRPGVILTAFAWAGAACGQGGQPVR